MKSDGENTCKGDSGAPLLINGRVAGIDSWRTGDPCGSKNSPRVFTEISKYRSWIDKIINENTVNIRNGI